MPKPDPANGDPVMVEERLICPICDEELDPVKGYYLHLTSVHSYRPQEMIETLFRLVCNGGA